MCGNHLKTSMMIKYFVEKNSMKRLWLKWKKLLL